MLFTHDTTEEQEKSVSEETRNKEQVYNARKLFSSGQHKDEIFDLLEKLQSHQRSDDCGFLCEVIVNASPCAILASKRQPDDLVSFCCHPEKFLYLEWMLLLS